MKPLGTLTIIILLTISANAQKHEYISFSQLKAGVGDKAKIDFTWPDQPDSAKYYSTLKMRDLLVAIQTMESKGFELVTLAEYGPGSLVIVINVYMRRNKKDKL